MRAAHLWGYEAEEYVPPGASASASHSTHAAQPAPSHCELADCSQRTKYGLPRRLVRSVIRGSRISSRGGFSKGAIGLCN